MLDGQWTWIQPGLAVTMHLYVNGSGTGSSSCSVDGTADVVVTS
jgi:hypothetical protein